MQPLDTYNPLTLKQFTTDREPDVVSFKVGQVVGGQFVPLAYDLLTSIGVLRFNLDGFDVTVEGCARATDGTSALLTWNTTYEPPGPHLLQPRLTLNGIGVDTAILSKRCQSRMALSYYLVSGIDYTFGQEEGCNEDCIQADVG
jgi:hypothetical protein